MPSGLSVLCGGIQIGHDPVGNAADANASFPLGAVPPARFRVRNEQHAVGIDMNIARAAELAPFRHELEVLIEDLNAVVAPVRDVQPSGSVERERVRRLELARARAQAAPALDELAVTRELRDARHRRRRRLRALTAVAFRDEDVAVGHRDDVARLVQVRRWVACDARCPQCQEDFAFGAELHHRVALALGVGKLLELGRGRGARVGHPHVTLTVDMKAVGEDEAAAAKARHRLA